MLCSVFLFSVFEMVTAGFLRHPGPYPLLWGTCFSPLLSFRYLGQTTCPALVCGHCPTTLAPCSRGTVPHPIPPAKVRAFCWKGRWGRSCVPPSPVPSPVGPSGLLPTLSLAPPQLWTVAGGEGCVLAASLPGPGSGPWEDRTLPGRPTLLLALPFSSCCSRAPASSVTSSCEGPWAAEPPRHFMNLAMAPLGWPGSSTTGFR